MPTMTARVPTPNASRYLVQLCKHWSHNCSVAYDAEHGTIDLGSDRRCEMWAKEARLVVTVEADSDKLPRLQEVVADHLQRFAHREGALVFDWKPE